MIVKLKKIFQKEHPGLVLVFGDTNSSLAGCLAAVSESIPVAHIEAGVRSGNALMPEELNRVLIDHFATICFCPNSDAALNLIKEGKKENVHVVGDPEFDTMNRFLPMPKAADYGTYLLLTLHRNFNVDTKECLSAVIEALGESGEKTIFPIHPRTLKNIKKFNVRIPKNIKITKPVGYRDTLRLIANAKKVLTDSGGVQREAFWMNVPVIILRAETEWMEIVLKGSGVLTGTNKEMILSAIKNFRGKISAPPVYGANEKIREVLYRHT